MRTPTTAQDTTIDHPDPHLPSGSVAGAVDALRGSEEPRSDMERLRMLLAGAGYAEIDGDQGADVRHSLPAKVFMVSRDGAAYGYQHPQSIDLAEGEGDAGMACSFFFDEAGALVGHSVWE